MKKYKELNLMKKKILDVKYIMNYIIHIVIVVK